jgi:nicotinamidase-related amidase
LIGFTILSRDDADGKSRSAEFRIALHSDILGQGAWEKLARMMIRKGFEGSLNNILRAMDYAASVGMPVATIQHSAAAKDSLTFRKGSEEWKLHPEIELRKRDILIEKSLPGSFTGTGLEKWLRDTSV